MTIQFICRGNTFRSIIAEAYVNSLNCPGVFATSSGTIASKCREMNAVNFPKTLGLLKKFGIDQYAKDHYADDISQDSLDNSDIVVFMNKQSYLDAADKYKLPQRMYVWNVVDVGEKGRIASTNEERKRFAEDAYSEIVNGIHELLADQLP